MHTGINTSVKLNLEYRKVAPNELFNEVVGNQRKELWGLGFFNCFFGFFKADKFQL